MQACFDTDCNGATSGSIFGMMHGAKALPEKWTAPLKDGLETGVAGYPLVKISEMASRSLEFIFEIKTKRNEEHEGRNGR